MTALMALGRKWDGKLLFEPRREDDVARTLQVALERRIHGIKSMHRPLTYRVAFRGEVRRRVQDPADPTQAGWSFLYNAADPLASHYAEILRPLAELRGMDASSEPLVFHGEPADQWLDWLTEHYHGRALEGGRPPGFVLIVGGPAQVPFAFQALLHTVASVGRLAPDRLENLQTYVDKVIQLERADAPTVDREVLFFAADEGSQDPTYFSRKYMVTPLTDHVRDELGYAVHVLAGDDATKAKLAGAFASRRPALVYAASHGLGAIDAPLEFQQRYNGALCCHRTGGKPLDSLFSVDDVPGDGAFLEGSVFFQFGCYGYGTPAESDYVHWLEGFPDTNAPSDFVAALPRRLLSHPRGPIAYISHVDTAFLHGFTDADDPHINARWHGRIAPFKEAVDGLLRDIAPPGFAMDSMSERYSAANAVLTNVYDSAQRQGKPWSPARTARFLDNWILRSDAQNFMVMGDPAALLRIPSP
jgi:hypothetical protein